MTWGGSFRVEGYSSSFPLSQRATFPVFFSQRATDVSVFNLSALFCSRAEGDFRLWTTRWASRGFERSLSRGDLVGCAFGAGGLCCSRDLASFVGLVSSGGWPSRRLRTASGLLVALLTAGCF